MKKLSESAINQNLENVNHWILNKNALEKSFVFKDFDEAMEVITKIAQESKNINHHPEWTNVYNKLKIRLSTHEISGISEKDFQLATAIDNIISYYFQQ